MISQACLALSITAVIFFIFGLVGGLFSSVKISDIELIQRKQITTSANISSCQKLNSTNCGCDDKKCDLCYLYQLTFNWTRNCGNISQILQGVDYLVISAQSNFNCRNNSTLNCYYQCTSLKSQAFLNKPILPSDDAWVGLLIFCCVAFSVALIFALMSYLLFTQQGQKYEEIL
jgi:hypothetical protein